MADSASNRRWPPLVLDFTAAWSGPQCTAVLADLGWDVVKVESAGRPDVTRRLGPWADGLPGLERSGYFQTLNRGKRSIAINLRAEAGRAIARQLCERADVVVENYSPGVMEKLGLGYSALAAANAGLVMASISGYGGTGPERSYVAYGQTIEAVAGLDGATGYAGGPPMACGAPIADHIAGMTAAGAILAAMHRRRLGGAGCHIDLSMVESLLALMPSGVINFQLTGVEPGPHGNADDELCPHGCYRCAGENRWLALTVANTEQWLALCRVLELAGVLDVNALVTAARRRERQPEVDVAIGGATRRQDATDLQARLRAAGVPATEVLDGYGLRADASLAQRGFFAEVETAEGGARTIPGRQALFSHLREGPPRRAPTLGEHTGDVLADVLGFEPGRVAELVGEGVLA